MSHAKFEVRDEKLGVVRLEQWPDEPRFVLWVGGEVVWDSRHKNSLPENSKAVMRQELRETRKWYAANARWME